MIINTNMTSINAMNRYGKNLYEMQKSMIKLGSGYKINSASDNAACLTISEKMRSQIRGLEQSNRNTQDAISLIQTAEGSLQQIQDLLHRGRELSVYASNGTLTEEDREIIQEELNQLRSEIDNITQSTEFNGVKLFNDKNYIPAPENPNNGTGGSNNGSGGTGGSGGTVTPTPPDNTGNIPSFPKNETDQIIYTLKQSALQVSEKLIFDNYGIKADGNTELKIVVSNNNTSSLAYLSYSVDPKTGKGYNLTLTVEKDDFLPATGDDGGTYPFYNDRIIAHEMVHAVMSQSMNYYSLPKWFKEGTAEFIHGADERVDADVYWNGVNGVVNAIGNGTDSTWSNVSKNYSAGYVAVRYLHDKIKAAGGDGIKDIMKYLNTNQKATLDDALKNIQNGAYSNGLTGFVTDFKANGASYINNMNLTNEDTGAIGGYDSDNGTVKTASSVIPFVDNYTDNPLEGFIEKWPTSSTTKTSLDNSIEINEISWVGIDSMDINKLKVNSQNFRTLNIQVGANSNQSVGIELNKIDSKILGISEFNVDELGKGVIDLFDNAISYISSERIKFGALQNRMEYILNVNGVVSEETQKAESLMRDTDMAREIVKLSKYNILNQATQSLLAQSNQSTQGVLNLLI